MSLSGQNESRITREIYIAQKHFIYLFIFFFIEYHILFIQYIVGKYIRESGRANCSEKTLKNADIKDN